MQMQPGTILVCSWGYSMTIVDFYKVVRCTDKTVWMQPIGNHVTATGYLSGTATPNLADASDKIIMRRRSKCGRYTTNENGYHTSIWDGKPKYFNHCD